MGRKIERTKNKISFCTTCKDRFWQIRQTLPINLEKASAFKDRVEFILVDFGSQDGLCGWVLENFKEELQSGYLKYYYTDALPKWHASIAKNTAHCLAKGEILVNLDADNFLYSNEVQMLLNLFQRYYNQAILSQFDTEVDRALHLGWSRLFMKKVLRERTEAFKSKLKGIKTSSLLGRLFLSPWEGGTFGRIAYPRKFYYDAGGFDENIEGIGYEEVDLLLRMLFYDAKRIFFVLDSQWAISMKKSQGFKNEIKETVGFKPCAIYQAISEKMQGLVSGPSHQSSRDAFIAMEASNKIKLNIDIEKGMYVKNNGSFGIKKNIKRMMPSPKKYTGFPNVKKIELRGKVLSS